MQDHTESSEETTTLLEVRVTIREIRGLITSLGGFKGIIILLFALLLVLLLALALAIVLKVLS